MAPYIHLEQYMLSIWIPSMHAYFSVVTKTRSVFSKGAKLIWKLRGSKESRLNELPDRPVGLLKLSWHKGAGLPGPHWLLSVGVWVCNLGPGYNSISCNSQMIDELGFSSWRAGRVTFIKINKHLLLREHVREYIFWVSPERQGSW